VDVLRRVQENVVQATDYQDLPADVRTVCSQDLWAVVRDNVADWQDVYTWNQVCTDASWTGLYPDADTALCHVALLLLPEGEWTDNTWGAWVQAIAQHLGPDAKRKDIFVTLRRVLTGQTSGPEMKALLPLIAPECVKARLNRTSAMAPRSVDDL
jgi:glutamyl-tRNA synthetase